MNRIPSPNFDERDPKIPLNYIVLHYTGMQDATSAAARLCDPTSKVSAHYIVGENGVVCQMIHDSKRAWHVGEGSWRGIKDMNSASIGIELVNPGHEFGYRSFPEGQINALKSLLNDLISKHRLSPTKALLAHSDIAPVRKLDPGELFPWESLAGSGLGLWPKTNPADTLSSSESEVSRLLKAIGYDTTSFPAAVLAFQRRFHPHALTGEADKETVAKIRAISRLVA